MLYNKTEHDKELDIAIRYLEIVFVILEILLIISSIIIGIVLGFAFPISIVLSIIVGIIFAIILCLINMWILKIVKAFAMVKYYSYENLILIRNNLSTDENSKIVEEK